MQTRSEQLFTSFCEDRGLEARRIPESKARGQKRPDYCLSLNGTNVVVEVKQFDPTEHETSADVGSSDGVRSYGTTPGDRIRKAIRRANQQFKAFVSNEHVPTLLVIFNNTSNRLHTATYSVTTAMRGLDAVEITIGGDRPRSMGPTKRSYKEQAMRRDANTSVSAVAVIERQDEGVAMVVFHNRFARHPLPPQMMRLPGVEQYRLPEDEESSSLGTEWQPC